MEVWLDVHAATDSRAVDEEQARPLPQQWAGFAHSTAFVATEACLKPLNSIKLSSCRRREVREEESGPLTCLPCSQSVHT